MTNRLAIFDVDGTLVDSQDHILAAMRYAFAQVDAPPPPRHAMLSVVGLSLATAFDVLSPEQPANLRAQLVAQYRAAFTDRQAEAGVSGHAPLYPGARGLLDRLAAPGGPALGIATGKARRGVDRMVDAHGLHDLFATAQCADDHPSKPDPSMVLRALDECGVSPTRAVMIGDTEFDIAMGQAAGVRTIAVSWGYHPVARLKAQRPDRIVDDFPALEAALDEVLDG